MLAAVVIAAVIELVDIASLRRLYRVWTGPLGRIYRHATRVDFIAAVAALLGVLIFDTLPGLFIGIGVSVLTLLYRSSRPHVARLVRRPGPDAVWVDHARVPDAVLENDIVVLRVESALFFANAEHVRDTVLASVTDETIAVVVDAETMPSIDVTGAGVLVALEKRLAARGIQLLVAKSIGQVRDVVATARTRRRPTRAVRHHRRGRDRRSRTRGHGIRTMTTGPYAGTASSDNPSAAVRRTEVPSS